IDIFCTADKGNTSGASVLDVTNKAWISSNYRQVPPDEEHANLRGRVIYRTKEDIRDWRGNPLFPPRQVNEPIVLDLGPDYRTWLENIHHFYRRRLGAWPGAPACRRL